MNAHQETAQAAAKPGGLPRLIDVIGVPSPAVCRRLLALLNLNGELPNRDSTGDQPAHLDRAA